MSKPKSKISKKIAGKGETKAKAKLKKPKTANAAVVISPPAKRKNNRKEKHDAKIVESPDTEVNDERENSEAERSTEDDENMKSTEEDESENSDSEEVDISDRETGSETDSNMDSREEVDQVNTRENSSPRTVIGTPDSSFFSIAQESARDRSNVNQSAEARKNMEAAWMQLVKAPEAEYSERFHKAFLDKILYVMNCAKVLEETLELARDQAETKEQKAKWSLDMEKARALRNRNQNNKAENAMHRAMTLLCNDYASVCQTKKLHKEWKKWKTQDIIDAINVVRIENRGTTNEAKFLADEFAAELAKAETPKKIADMVYKFQVTHSAKMQEFMEAPLEEITANLRSIKQNNRTLSASTMLGAIDDKKVENPWSLFEYCIKEASKTERLLDVIGGHFFPGRGRDQIMEGLNELKRKFNSIPQGKEKLGEKRPFSSKQTTREACYICGGTSHWAAKCDFKMHPNANSDKNRTWESSEGGTLQRELRIARKGEGGKFQLNASKTAKRDNTGAVEIVNTPEGLIPNFEKIRGDGKRAVSAGKPTQMNDELKSKRPRFTNKKTGKSTSTLNALIEEIASLNDDPANLITLNSSNDEQTNETDMEQDMDVDQRTGIKFKETPCRIAHGNRRVYAKLFPDPGSINYNLTGSYVNKSFFLNINKILQVPIFSGPMRRVGVAVTGGKVTEVSEFVFLDIQIISRTLRTPQRACFKVYLAEGLVHNILIGKTDLLEHSWIQSPHLWGWANKQIQEATQEDAINAYLEYEEEGLKIFRENPMVAQIIKSRTALSDQVIEHINHMYDAEIESGKAIPLVSNRSKHDNPEYFLDNEEEDDDYVDGELPTEITGSDKFINHMKELHKKYSKVFSTALKATPAKVEPFKLKIDKKMWLATKRQHGNRSMSFPKQQALNEYINAGLACGLFEHGTAEVTSHVNMVPKPEAGKWRMTCDFRIMNTCCAKDDYPIPKIQDIFGKIAARQENARVFAKIDLKDGFHQIPMDKESQIFSAFTTFRGIYFYLRMPMGTKGASQYFQMVLSKVLEKIPEFGVLIHLYIDDIFVHAKDEEELAALLEKVYKVLLEHNFIINPKKTVVGATRLEYLGHTITSEGMLLVNDSKKRALFDFPKPVFKKQLKSFLGILNTFKDNIKDRATLQKPLDMLCGGYSRKVAAQRVQWTDEASAAYEKLKDSIDKMPSLHLLKGKDKYKIVLRTDASDYGCGAHLVQKERLGTNPDGSEMLGEDQTIMFVSKAFDETQKKWCVSEKECYGAWYACKKLEHLLEGETFQIETDHKNLTILDESENAKVQRWKAYLQRYDATWKYIKGETNNIADAMSRIVDIPEASQDMIMSYYDSDIIAAMMEAVEEMDVSKDHSEFLNALSEEKGSSKSNQRLNKEETEFLMAAISKVHNALEGHMGVKRTTDLLNRYLQKISEEGGIPKGVNMPRLSLARRTEAVKAYLDRCAVCQKMDDKGEKIPVRPFTLSTYAQNECIQVDHVGPFLKDEKTGATHILVVIDTFTRWTELYPVAGTGEHEAITALSDYCLRYGKPMKIMSDRASSFLGSVIRLFGKVVNVEFNSPEFANDKQQTGIVERANAEVRRHLVTIMHELSLKRNWPFACKFVQRILNNSVHSSTGIAPARLMYGSLISSPEQTLFNNNEDDISRSDFLQEKYDMQKRIIQIMRERLIEKDELNLEKRMDNQEGLLKNSEYVLHKILDKTKQQMSWQGPFMVTNAKGDWYELSSLTNDKPPFYAHARNIKRYREDGKTSALEVAYKDDIGVIEKIVAYKNPNSSFRNKNGVQIGVTYKDYPEDVHWLPLNQVENKQIFVEYCLANSIFSWISPTAKALHQTTIDEYRNKLQPNAN